MLLLTKNRKAICALPILVLFNFLELRRPTWPLMHQHRCVHRSATDPQHHSGARRTTFYSTTPNLWLLLSTSKKGAYPSPYGKYWGIIHRLEEPTQWLWPKAFCLHWREMIWENSNGSMHLLLITGIIEGLWMEKTAKITSSTKEGHPLPLHACCFPHHAWCCSTTAILPQRIGP